MPLFELILFFLILSRGLVASFDIVCLHFLQALFSWNYVNCFDFGHFAPLLITSKIIIRFFVGLKTSCLIFEFTNRFDNFTIYIFHLYINLQNKNNKHKKNVQKNTFSRLLLK
jgi:hypothetical protein